MHAFSCSQYLCLPHPAGTKSTDFAKAVRICSARLSISTRWAEDATTIFVGLVAILLAISTASILQSDSSTLVVEGTALQIGAGAILVYSGPTLTTHVNREQTPLMQSLSTEQRWFWLHFLGQWGPPQSTSVSLPLSLLSVQVLTQSGMGRAVMIVSNIAL